MTRTSAYKTAAAILIEWGITPAKSGFKIAIEVALNVLFEGDSMLKSLKNAASDIGLTREQAYRALRTCSDGIFGKSYGDDESKVQSFVADLCERIAVGCYKSEFSKKQSVLCGIDEFF